MVKVLLGAVTGTGLYLYSNSPSAGENGVAFYLAGMAVLALTCTWALRAARIRARVRTALYLLRSRRIAMEHDGVTTPTWVPLVESTQVVTVKGSRTDEGRIAISA